MAWSWSHSNEAYAAAESNLRKLDRETLEVIFAEWRAAQEKGGAINPVLAAFSKKKYERALRYAKTLPDDVLADFIWEKASEFATCTNGGWEAWMCPHGCGCHMVPFDTQDELEHAGE